MKFKDLIKNPVGIIALLGFSIITGLTAYKTALLAVDFVIERSDPITKVNKRIDGFENTMDSMNWKMDALLEKNGVRIPKDRRYKGIRKDDEVLSVRRRNRIP